MNTSAIILSMRIW